MLLETSYLTWVGFAILVTITPGPDTLIIGSHAARRGFSAGLLAITGLATGGLWYIVLCGFGYLSLLAVSPIAFLAVKVMGAAYLSWIGITMIRNAVQRDVIDKAIVLREGHPYRDGLLTNILNPKLAIFYLAALPQFVGVGANAGVKGMLLIGTHYVIGVVYLVGIAWIAAKAARHFKRSSITRTVEGVVGAFLVGVGMRVAFQQNS